MTYKSTPADDDRNRRHRDARNTSAAMVAKTREAWMARPVELLPLEANIAVGIGFAALTRGGWLIFEEGDHAGAGPMTVAEAEKLAQRAPEHEWCIHLVGPDAERHYKRVGQAQWKLYQWGSGIGRPSHRAPNYRSTSQASAQA